MGNRAVITTSTAINVQASKDIGVYIHWNGGEKSVTAFLMYCKLKGYASPEKDCYGWARLCQVIGNFFGGVNSVGIDQCCKLDCDNGDNGTYIIRDWRTIDHKYTEPCRETYNLFEVLQAINKAQPASEQLSDEFLYEGMQAYLDPEPF